MSTVIGVAGLALAASGELRARRAGVVEARRALSDAGSSIARELAMLAALADGATEPVAGVASPEGARRGACMARLCASCERAEDLVAALRAKGGLPDGAAAHLDGLLADADRALREAERGDVPAPGLAPRRAEQLAAALQEP